MNRASIKPVFSCVFSAYFREKGLFLIPTSRDKGAAVFKLETANRLADCHFGISFMKASEDIKAKL